MSSFVRNCETVFQRLYYFAFPWAMNESSCCSTSLSTFGIVSVPDFGHSYRCLVISHCCFILHFPDDKCCGALFPTFICYLYVFFGEVSVKIRLFSYYWVLIILYIFWIIVLYQVIFCKYFLLVCGLFSHSLDTLLCRTEIFNFNEAQLIDSLSWIMPLVLYLKSHWHTQVHLGFLLCYLLGVL